MQGYSIKIPKQMNTLTFLSAFTQPQYVFQIINQVSPAEPVSLVHQIPQLLNQSLFACTSIYRQFCQRIGNGAWSRLLWNYIGPV